MKHFEEIHLLHPTTFIFSSVSCPYPLSTIILFTFLLVFEPASAVAPGVKAPAAFLITYPTVLKAATGQCAYFHSNSSPAQHSQIGHPLPSPAKQTKTRNKTLPKHGGVLWKLSPTYEYLWILYDFAFVFVLVEENICMWSRADQCFKSTTSSAEFFYDDIHPASGPRTRRWEFKCSNKCSDVTYPPCHHATIAVIHNRNPVWCWLSQASIQHAITSSNF